MHLLLYLLSYFLWAIWSLTEGVFLPSAPWFAFLVASFVKALIWIAPFLLWSCIRKDKLLIRLSGMFRKPFPWFPTFVGLCLSVAFLHTAHIFLSGVDVWGIFDPMWIAMSLAAAVIEEIAFRGLLFNQQAAKIGVPWAALLNGIFFAVYHYPEFLTGQNLSAIYGIRFVVITAMGIIYSTAFAKWKNLHMTIILHFVWNMLCYWFALA